MGPDGVSASDITSIGFSVDTKSALSLRLYAGDGSVEKSDKSELTLEEKKIQDEKDEYIQMKSYNEMLKSLLNKEIALREKSMWNLSHMHACIHARSHDAACMSVSLMSSFMSSSVVCS